MTTPNNNTHLIYDWLGRKTAMDDPDMGVWSYAYNNLGNLKRQTDARNQSVCFTYDDLNRVTQKEARTGTAACDTGTVAYSVSYGYDSTTGGNFGWGRRTSMTDPSGGTSWTYDLEGQVVRTSQTITGAPNNPYETEATYDAMGRVRTTTYPFGEVVTQNYNLQGLPDTLAGTGNYITNSTYNAAGQPTLLTHGNGYDTTFTYHTNTQRLATLLTGPGNSVQNLSFQYDNVGNVTRMTNYVPNPDQVNDYTYDNLDRLTAWDLVGTFTQPVFKGW